MWKKYLVCGMLLIDQKISFLHVLYSIQKHINFIFYNRIKLLVLKYSTWNSSNDFLRGMGGLEGRGQTKRLKRKFAIFLPSLQEYYC